jgi:hypothetical protein
MTGGEPMEFGLFHEFQDTSEAEAFSQSFALVDAAEQWGLDANFAPDRWVLASPLILAAAIAQRTLLRPTYTTSFRRAGWRLFRIESECFKLLAPFCSSPSIRACLLSKG